MWRLHFLVLLICARLRRQKSIEVSFEGSASGCISTARYLGSLVQLIIGFLNLMQLGEGQLLRLLQMLLLESAARRSMPSRKTSMNFDSLRITTSTGKFDFNVLFPVCRTWWRTVFLQSSPGGTGRGTEQGPGEGVSSPGG